MAKKSDAKAFALQKRKKRQWITFMRMIRYGVNNFSRNAWLTIAATAVMTITLLIVFMTLTARSTLVSTVDTIRNKVDISIYVKPETSEKDVAKIQSDIRALESVRQVTYVSPEEGREAFAKDNASDPTTLEVLNEATGKLPGRVRVNLVDINETAELRKFVETNQNLKDNISDQEPSFSGERRSAIESIGRSVEFVDRAGIIASVVFIAISSLIVFNTIRMAIFNRKEEIQMMKLIGADRSFIRGPFVVEAMVYGFIAAIIAVGLGLLLLSLWGDSLANQGIAIAPTIDFISTYIGFILLGMIILGGLVGVISSLLATRRYLKI